MGIQPKPRGTAIQHTDHSLQSHPKRNIYLSVIVFVNKCTNRNFNSINNNAVPIVFTSLRVDSTDIRRPNFVILNRFLIQFEFDIYFDSPITLVMMSFRATSDTYRYMIDNCFLE